MYAWGFVGLKKRFPAITATGVRVDAGRQAMRVVFDSSDPDVYVCNLNWIEARSSTTPAAAPSSASEKQAKKPLDDQRD